MLGIGQFANRAPRPFAIRAVLDALGVLSYGFLLAIAVLPATILTFLLRPFMITPGWRAWVAWSFWIAASYMLFAAALLIEIVGARLVLRLGSVKGSVPIDSFAAVRFAMLHGLLNLAQILVLRAIRGTSMLNAFYRAMGATIGHRTIVNSVLLSDCDLVAIGDDCVVGGDAVINGHSAERGVLVRRPIVIGNRVTIGQYATILPGVTIESDVVVGANSLVPKSRVLMAGHTYAGVPVRVAGEGVPESSEATARPALDEKSDDERISSAPFRLSREEIQIQPLLLESYRMRHAEVLDIVRFMAQVTITSLGLFVSLFLYSIVFKQPRLLLFIPPLAGLVFAIVLGSASAMLRLGYKACEIELMFRNARVEGFDWELKYGSLGSARIWDLDAILAQGVVLVLFVAGTWFTATEFIVVSNDRVFGVREHSILVGLDLALGGWVLLSTLYILFRQRTMRRALAKIALEQTIAN